jgi:hypothetical protein
LVVGFVAALAATGALAQPPDLSDPIDQLLRKGLAKDADPDEPDTAATGARVEPDPKPASRYVPPPRSTLTAPVFLEETGRNPDAPPSAADLAYDNRIRASMAAAQGFSGPLEGGWTMVAGARELFVLQLIDRRGAVEGAWRDLRRQGVAGSGSGFVDEALSTSDGVTLRFAGDVAVLRLAAGRWSGELTEAGRTEPVSLRRRNP